MDEVEGAGTFRTSGSADDRYTGFDDLWAGFLEGVGPAGSYAVSLPDDRDAPHHGRTAPHPVRGAR